MRHKAASLLGGDGRRLLATLATSVLGHHAFGGEFDPNKPVLLKGKVTKIEWVNPHAWIHVESRPRPDGARKRKRRGWSKAARRTRCSAAASPATR